MLVELNVLAKLLNLLFVKLDLLSGVGLFLSQLFFKFFHLHSRTFFNSYFSNKLDELVSQLFVPDLPLETLAAGHVQTSFVADTSYVMYRLVETLSNFLEIRLGLLAAGNIFKEACDTLDVRVEHIELTSDPFYALLLGLF